MSDSNAVFLACCFALTFGGFAGLLHYTLGLARDVRKLEERCAFLRAELAGDAERLRDRAKRDRERGRAYMEGVADELRREVRYHGLVASRCAKRLGIALGVQADLLDVDGATTQVYPAVGGGRHGG